jgi:Txe/YoeB family toxin of Txe-Axe toxin-antitoxin module
MNCVGGIKMLNIKIKDKEYCSNKKWLGETRWISKSIAQIVISRKKNPNPIEFFLTLIHEMLHVWIAIMKYNGIRIPHEHRFIYSIEDDIIKEIKKLAKETKHEKEIKRARCNKIREKIW